MGSSKQRPSLYDPLRMGHFAATPEEVVRQSLVEGMHRSLGFPKKLICVERELSEIPHLQGRSDLPKRRVDLLCFAKGIHPEHDLFPLLLIECKEGFVGKVAAEQALGYNHYIGAPFVAIAGKNGAQLIYPKKLDFLPCYDELVEAAKRCL